MVKQDITGVLSIWDPNKRVQTCWICFKHIWLLLKLLNILCFCRNGSTNEFLLTSMMTHGPSVSKAKKPILKPLKRSACDWTSFFHSALCLCPGSCASLFLGFFSSLLLGNQTKSLNPLLKVVHQTRLWLLCSVKRVCFKWMAFSGFYLFGTKSRRLLLCELWLSDTKQHAPHACGSEVQVFKSLKPQDGGGDLFLSAPESV